jgi:sn-glycerol 3-phosphate transport system substrate-binding protein
MPFNVSDPVLYYNKKIFQQAGLDPNDPPLSLEELRADSQKIVDSKAAGYGIALDTGADSGGGWFLEQWFAKAGELFANNENGRAAPATSVLYDGPTGVQLITYLQNLVKDGLAVNVGDNASGQDNFLKLADPAKPAAMTIGTSAALGSVLNIVRGGIIPGIKEADIGVGPMPGPGGAPGALVGGAALWVVAGKGDAKTAAVWDYIKFLVDAQTQSTWAADSGYVPVRSDAVDLDPIKTRYVTDPRFKVAYSQLLEAADKPSSLGPVLGPQRDIRQVTAHAMAAALNGTPVQKALTDGATQSNKLLANYSARH